MSLFFNRSKSSFVLSSRDKDLNMVLLSISEICPFISCRDTISALVKQIDTLLSISLIFLYNNPSFNFGILESSKTRSLS